MTTSDKDILLAILAMDSYNQGYGAGIKQESSQVGPAQAKSLEEVGVDSDLYKAWKDAGFYAVAYEVKAGAWEGLEKDTTVISYRGTDDFAPQYV